MQTAAQYKTSLTQQQGACGTSGESWLHNRFLPWTLLISIMNSHTFKFNMNVANCSVLYYITI